MNVILFVVSARDFMSALPKEPQGMYLSIGLRLVRRNWKSPQCCAHGGLFKLAQQQV
jgi:hypothetical protein